MLRMLNGYLVVILMVVITACSDLGNKEVETILRDARVYPLTLEYRMFCNSDRHVQEVIEKNLVADGLVTAQLKHTVQDLGKPLIYFTEKAQPYLLATNDTLKSFDIQRIRAAEEVFLQVRNIEINPSGDIAVVDYSTKIVNPTPFIVLYNQDINGAQNRRTFFTRVGAQWVWDGKIVNMLK